MGKEKMWEKVVSFMQPWGCGWKTCTPWLSSLKTGGLVPACRKKDKEENQLKFSLCNFQEIDGYLSCAGCEYFIIWETTTANCHSLIQSQSFASMALGQKSDLRLVPLRHSTDASQCLNFLMDRILSYNSMGIWSTPFRQSFSLLKAFFGITVCSIPMQLYNKPHEFRHWETIYLMWTGLDRFSARKMYMFSASNFFHTQRKKLPNLGLNSWFPFQAHTV